MTGCEPANATQSSKWGKWFIAEFAPHLCADGRRRCGPLRVPKGASAGPAVSGARAGCARVCTSLEWDVGQVLGRLVVYVAIGNGVPVGVGERVGGSRRRLPGHAGPDDRPARRRRARPDHGWTCRSCLGPSSPSTARAKALGYAMHFIAGQVFAFAYFGIFAAIGRGHAAAPWQAPRSPPTSPTPAALRLRAPRLGR
jgi:hypothetical protein